MLNVLTWQLMFTQACRATLHEFGGSRGTNCAVAAGIILHLRALSNGKNVDPDPLTDTSPCLAHGRTSWGWKLFQVGVLFQLLYSYFHLLLRLLVIRVFKFDINITYFQFTPSIPLVYLILILFYYLHYFKFDSVYLYNTSTIHNSSRNFQCLHQQCLVLMQAVINTILFTEDLCNDYVKIFRSPVNRFQFCRLLNPNIKY